jgi:hypothetical protein
MLFREEFKLFLRKTYILGGLDTSLTDGFFYFGPIRLVSGGQRELQAPVLKLVLKLVPVIVPVLVFVIVLVLVCLYATSTGTPALVN